MQFKGEMKKFRAAGYDPRQRGDDPFPR